MDFKGKVAFVTGGSGDIGGAIAGALAMAGADVAISYVGQLEAAAATVDALRASGRRSLAVQLDETNLRGPYLLARALAPHLRAHRTGRIVNIASVGGLFPASSSILAFPIRDYSEHSWTFSANAP